MNFLNLGIALNFLIEDSQNLYEGSFVPIFQCLKQNFILHFSIKFTYFQKRKEFPGGFSQIFDAGYSVESLAIS